jgi:hypothetical protein
MERWSELAIIMALRKEVSRVMENQFSVMKIELSEELVKLIEVSIKSQKLHVTYMQSKETISDVQHTI